MFEKDIHIFANYEMFIEPLESNYDGGVCVVVVVVVTSVLPSLYNIDEDPMKHPTQMQVYVRHWRPSSYTVDKSSEIILNENTPQHLKLKLSEFSGIPAQRIQFAKVWVEC